MKAAVTRGLIGWIAVVSLILFALACQQQKPTPAGPTAEDEQENARAASQIAEKIIAATNERNMDAMASHYSSDPENVFYGPGPTADGIHGGQEYVKAVFSLFDNIAEFKSTANRESMRTIVSGNLASVSLTGFNEVTDIEGNTGASSWRWTYTAEKTGSDWKLVGENFAFIRPMGDIQTLIGEARAKACLASISVDIEMLDLDLRMKTEKPVQWYSKVETIPPVNYTASVSLTPTPLIADGREVGTLESGTVKFREIVDHVHLPNAKTGEIASLDKKH